MNRILAFSSLLCLICWSCIGDDFLDDFVEPEIRIINQVDSITIDSIHQFSATYFNNVGRESAVSPVWSSSDPSVIEISSSGLATGRSLGSAEISVAYDDGQSTVNASTVVHTAANPVVMEEPQTRRGTIRTTSSYELKGSFTIEETDTGGILIKIGADYVATRALPDLFLYLTNNPNSIADAMEVADVMIFSGAHEYVIENVGIDDYSHLLYYCKPFTVKVGDGEILND